MKQQRTKKDFLTDIRKFKRVDSLQVAWDKHVARAKRHENNVSANDEQLARLSARYTKLMDKIGWPSFGRLDRKIVVSDSSAQRIIITMRYAKTCAKWGGYDPRYKIVIRLGVWESIKYISGVLTFTARDGKSFWISEGRQHCAKIACGYVIDQRHILAETLEEAQQINAEIEAKFARKIKKIGLKWVTISDSHKAGNCIAGTQQFMRRCRLDKLGAIRSDYLLELALQHDLQSFALRAIEQSDHVVAR